MPFTEYPAVLPYWCPEAMDLREKTIEAEVHGVLRIGHPRSLFVPMAWFTITKLPDGVYTDDALNLSINRAAHAALLWNGGREPDEPEPISDGEAFWGDVHGFGEDDDCCADCQKLGECACYGSDDLIDCDLDEPEEEEGGDEC